MRAAISELMNLDKALSYSQLCWRPHPQEWSIGQVVEHLILTDAPAIDPISRLVANGPRGETPWKPTIMGRLLTKAVEPTTRWKTNAKKGYLPTESPRRDVVRQYIAIRERLLLLVEQSQGLNLNRMKTKYPIPTPLAYNLGDAFMILTRHTQRHLQQISQIRLHPSFPGGDGL